MTSQDPRVETLAKILGALSFLASRKEKWEAMLTEAGISLSQGEEALASLARDARKAALAEAVVKAAERYRELQHALAAGPLLPAPADLDKARFRLDETLAAAKTALREIAATDGEGASVARETLGFLHGQKGARRDTTETT